MAVCVEHGVPVAPIYDAADILKDIHMAARGDIVTVQDQVAGPVRQQAPFPRLDGEHPRTPAPAPMLGQHNREVWSNLVGLDEEELVKLQTEGVI